MDRRNSPIVDIYEATPNDPSLRGKSLAWLYILLTIVAFFALESIRPVMRLRPAPPAYVLGETLSHAGNQHDSQHPMSQACWDYAVTSLQNVYPYGSDLPHDPPPTVSRRITTSSAVGELCWPGLRKAWTQPESWGRSYEWSADWATDPHSPFRESIHNALVRLGLAQ
jgi:hypothetical protein